MRVFLVLSTFAFARWVVFCCLGRRSDSVLLLVVVGGFYPHVGVVLFVYGAFFGVLAGWVGGRWRLLSPLMAS